tara:strand:+ start:58109 stop:58852 length:744 start_codon:yes stop_codon:yes gene_type:complete
MREQPSFHKFGDEAVRFCWPGEISTDLNQRILSLADEIQRQFKQQIEDVTIGYNELCVHFPTIEKAQKFAADYQSGEITLDPKNQETSGSHLYIPVCYEDTFSPDLKRICESKGLNEKQLIDLHTAPIYRVFFIGFLPGFPYLGGMREEISMPRLDKPRRQVRAGSVGIAGNQTGIYPTSSPGGWNLIGQTPIRLFDPNDSRPTLFTSGDQISFYPIKSGEFESLKNELTLKNTVELRSYCINHMGS